MTLNDLLRERQQKADELARLDREIEKMKDADEGARIAERMIGSAGLCVYAQPHDGRLKGFVNLQPCVMNPCDARDRIREWFAAAINDAIRAARRKAMEDAFAIADKVAEELRPVGAGQCIGAQVVSSRLRQASAVGAEERE